MVEKAQKKGQFPADIDARLASLLLLFAAVGTAALPQIIKLVGGLGSIHDPAVVDGPDNVVAALRFNHLVDSVSASLTASCTPLRGSATTEPGARMDEPSDAVPPAGTPHPHPGRVVSVLAMAGLGSSFVFTAIIPIQTHLPTLFDSGRDHTAWAVTATLLVAAVLTPISGRVADMVGKRRVALSLLALLAVGSVICTCASELWVLILGRGLQGASTGIIPVGIAILRDTIPPRRLDPSIGLMSATLGVGGAIGLPISAIVNQLAGWRWTFGATAVFAVVVGVLVAAIIPASPQRSAGRFDILGATGLAFVISAVLLMLSYGAAWGWTSPVALATAGTTVVVLALWVRHESRTSNALLDLRLARTRPVLMTNLTSFAVGFALFASNIVYPQQLELPRRAGGFGLSLTEASLVMMPPGLIMLVLAPVTGRLARRFGPRLPLLIGTTFLVAAYGHGLAFSSEIWNIVVTNALIGVGVGFGYAAMPSLIVRAVPAHATGASNGLNTLFRSLGTSVASASIGGVLATMSRDMSGIEVPTPDSFHLAILMGLIASASALVLATIIPRTERV